MMSLSAPRHRFKVSRKTSSVSSSRVAARYLIPGQHPGGKAGGQVADAAGQRCEHGGERAAGQLHDEQGYGQDGKAVAEHGHGLTAEENPFPQHRFIICRVRALVNASCAAADALSRRP
jgi:hypothetical protein